MNDLSLESMQRQLDNLTRAHRRLKRVGGAVLLGAVLLAATGAVHLQENTKLVVNELTVQDKEGRPRIWLGTSAGDGMPLMYFHDAQGIPRLQVQLSIHDGGYIGFLDSQARHRLIMSEASDGSPYLNLYDDQSPYEARFHVGMSGDDGRPHIQFYDRGEPDAEGRFVPRPDIQPRLNIGMSTDKDAPFIQFLDAKGRSRLFMDQLRDGSSMVSFFDQKETARLSLGQREDGSPGLSFWNAEGLSRASIGTEPDGSVGMVLVDDTGATRLGTKLSPDGVPSLSLFDTRSKKRLGMSLENDKPFLIMKDENEHEIIDIGVDPEKGSGLILRDVRDRTRGVMQATPDGDARFLVLDPDGKAVFQAPAP